MVDHGFHDATGRHVIFRDVDADNWRAVADVAPRDEQRRFVAALAARYLLLSLREGVWDSLAVCADESVVGHIMWGLDKDDGSYWIGGFLVDEPEQGKGVGRAMLQTMIAHLAGKPHCRVIQASYHPENVAAARLYGSAGFTPTRAMEGDEMVIELRLADSQKVHGPSSN
jgi:diamine N-acetyltransferase